MWGVARVVQQVLNSIIQEMWPYIDKAVASSVKVLACCHISLVKTYMQGNAACVRHVCVNDERF